MRTDVRADKRIDGEQSLQVAQITQLGADSYIWQPWFATVRTRLDLSRVDTFAVTDSTSNVTSGEGRVLLFPRSHFPLEAYVVVTDSRIELDSTLDQTGGFRRTRAGLLQRYRDADFGATYTAGYEHVDEDNDDGGEVSDELRLEMIRQVEHHDFSASADIESRRRDQRDESLIDGVFTARHSYNPDSTLSVESSSTFVNVDRDSRFIDVTQRSALLTSTGTWRPQDSRLRVTVNGRSFLSQIDSNGFDTVSMQGGASLAATYDVTDELRASGSLGANVTGGDAASTVSTAQSATVSYTPDVVDLAGYSYNYFATGSASNRTESEDGATPAVGGTIGHTLNRALPLAEDGSWQLSASLGQTLGSSFIARDGGTQNVTHSASAAFTRSVRSAISTLRITGNDSRSFGGFASTFQNINLQATHTSTVGRYVSWQANFNSQLVRLDNEDGSRSQPVSSASINYRNGFLLGVRRLRLNSELSASANSLQPFTIGDEDNDQRLTWDSRLEYSIGRVDVRLRGTVVRRADAQNFSIFLSVSRGFDGVF